MRFAGFHDLQQHGVCEIVGNLTPDGYVSINFKHVGKHLVHIADDAFGVTNENTRMGIVQNKFAKIFSIFIQGQGGILRGKDIIRHHSATP